MQMLRLIVCLTFWLFICAVGQAQTLKTSQHLASVSNLPSSIYDVKGIGNWEKGGLVGQIRLVIARANKHDEVFLQWIQWDDIGPEKIIKTVLVEEILQRANFKITFIRRETIEDERQLILGLENLYDGSSSRAFIKIEGVGRYRCHIQ
jgi:hypothetical protein